MEIPFLFIFAGIILYLRLRAKYADLRTNAEKESQQLQTGINLYNEGVILQALVYFTHAIEEKRGLSVAHLYRARCHRATGNIQAAMADLEVAKSYDDTQADIYLEIGQIHFKKREFDDAFINFDKAVFYSHGKKVEPYYWRGMTQEKLGQHQEAQLDLQKAASVQQDRRLPETFTLLTQSPFFNNKLWVYMGLTVLNSIALLVVIKVCPVVHGPYLLATISAVLMGLVESRKGWILALIQVSLIWLGYFFFTEIPTTTGERELEQFNLYGSIGLTFAGSYLGSVLITEYRRVADYE